jgi:hypothetical protein
LRIVRCNQGLVQHTREQHKESAELVPPSLYPHHHLREEDHGILTSGTTKKRWNALSPLCAMTPTTHDMRQHFCYRHYDQGLSFNEDRSYDKCDLCMKHVRPARLAEHQESKTFARECETEERELIAAAQLPAPHVHRRRCSGTGVEVSVSGTDPSQDDHDLSACVRNIQPRQNGLPSPRS